MTQLPYNAGMKKILMLIMTLIWVVSTSVDAAPAQHAQAKTNPAKAKLAKRSHAHAQHAKATPVKHSKQAKAKLQSRQQHAQHQRMTPKKLANRDPHASSRPSKTASKPSPPQAESVAQQKDAMPSAAAIAEVQTIDSGNTDLSKPVPSWSNYAQDVIVNALSLMGVKYVWGGKTPESGLDCSGFVRFVFQQATNLTLPHGARAISQMGSHVASQDLQPGDLVFFNTLKSSFSHVGIYIGENRFIHSPRTGKAIVVTDMTDHYWAQRFNGARRIDPTELKALNDRYAPENAADQSRP